MDTNRQRLLQASQLIEAAKGTLNREKHACDHCGLTVRHNWSEDQAGETLGGIVTKLHRLLDHEGLQPWLDGPA